MDPELQLIMSRGDVLADAVIEDVQHMSPTVRAMFHGDELADKLGVEQNWTSALLPMLTDANRFRWQYACSDNSRWQTFVSQSHQAIRDFEASLVGPTEYQPT
jgi:hypothetical protein